MKALSRSSSGTFRRSVPVLFLVGVALLFGAWMVIYWSESLFTESHLVGYYCCVTDQDLPARGTLARTASDIFRTFPGKHLLSLIFVTANLWCSVHSLKSARGAYPWWLPFLFVVCGIVYLLTSFWLVGISWSISNRLVGPQTSAYKGYDRTWYGIVLHLMLWVGYFAALSKVATKLTSKSPVAGD